MITMTIMLLVALGLLLISFLMGRAYAAKPTISCPVNLIPKERPILDEQDRKWLDLYLQEWRVVVETQMHFNDLILRFRSVTLTALITLIGATVALVNAANLSKAVLALPLLFWIPAFIMDYVYYYRLLLGSVIQAKKYDEAFRSYGLFGMTECISSHIQPARSNALVLIYYAAPVVAGLLLWLLARLFGGATLTLSC